MHACLRVMYHDEYVETREMNNFWELNFSFHHRGSRDQTQVVMFGGLSPLYSHWPCFAFEIRLSLCNLGYT